jgi:hypothetical protein
LRSLRPGDACASPGARPFNVQDRGGADEFLQRGGVKDIAFADIDGAPRRKL